MKRYSAIAVFDKDLDRVVLIEKQKPAWQAGKANFPGGEVELQDFDDPINGWGPLNQAHLRCAVRELAEETGLVVNPDNVKHFATLRFTTAGEPGECRFFCCVGDVDAVDRHPPRSGPRPG